MTSSRPFRAAAGQRSFTMIEILVACAVLVLILALLAQMMGIVNRAAREGLDRVDNFTKSRAMLDLICNDLERGVFRPDLPNFLNTGVTTYTNNNSSVYYTGSIDSSSPGPIYAFYTQVAGMNTNGSADAASYPRGVSLVYYTLHLSSTNDPNMVILQRNTLPVAADETGAQSLSFGQTIETNGAVALQTAPGVVGFRLAIRRADGTVQDMSQYTGYDKNNNPVIAVGVSLAVLGNRPLTELYSMGGKGLADVTSIQDYYQGSTFTISSNNPESYSYKAQWDSQWSFLTNNLPRSVATGFKTYERWVSCGPF